MPTGCYKRPSLAERFWEKVDKNGPMQPTLRSRCWLWVGGSRTREGYGRVGIGPQKQRRYKYATHVVWFLTHGVWPTHQMLHRCDNPACVNPAHLFEGTHNDNMKDKVRKGRQPRGEKIGTSKLTIKEVRTIRALAATGVRQRELAKRFGVAERHISSIVRRQQWKHARRA